MDIRREVLDRFLRYVKIDTQSQEGVEDRYPSTEKQLDLSRLLVDELKQLGLDDVEIDKHGYVTATLPENIPAGAARAKKIPVVGLLAHVDTYPEVSGKDVKPVIHENYPGGDLELPALPGDPIRAADNPDLASYKGEDIITSDGSTLLGADDKAGVAEIMTLLALYRADDSLPHPCIRVAFTPDEEVGNGTQYFDVKAFGADLAYTMDGSGMGEVEDETFCADSAVVTLSGIDVHPGYAKNKMVNAVRLAAMFVDRLPTEALPETTDGRQDYLHAYQLDGNVSKVTMTVLVRSFSEDGLAKMEDTLQRVRTEVLEKEPRAQIDIHIKESYRNMKYVLDKHPQAVLRGEEAVRRAGLEPKRMAIRGGTDGARLSFEGLPTPNLSAGGYNFHSKKEWIPVKGLSMAVEVLKHLMAIYVER
ncbi:MAG TPA: peptidase T [Myxococcota bacterium]|nr:peptidase T [Myxococcota bacterium]